MQVAEAAAAYNHHLLQEHLQVEEQIAAERAEQEALLDSYRSARKGRPTLPATRGRISTAPLRRRPPATRQRTSPALPRPRTAANEAAPHGK